MFITFFRVAYIHTYIHPYIHTCCCWHCRSVPRAHALVALQPFKLIVLPCSPLVLDVPTVAARCLHVQATREIEAAKGGTLWARIVSDNFA
jgi:hypothetical protein